VATASAAAGRSSLTAILAVEAATAGAPTMGLIGELGAEATAVAEATRMLTVKIRQPSHEFTFGVGMSFIPYPLVLTPVV
jgi:hypothetical protein